MGAVSGHNWFHPCIHSNWVLALLKLAGVSYMLGASYLLAVCCLIVLVLLHVFPTSLCKAGPALSRQKKGRAVEKAEACETMHYSTHTWEASLLPYSMLAVKARTRPVQMSRLKNRFYLLRRAPVKSYYKDHGHKERDREQQPFLQ